MIKYKAIISYDGTNYHGWQIQPDKPTISQLLQDRFYAVFNQKIKIVGASRTDAGVHALGQVGIFDIDFDIKTEKLLLAWNSLLPPEVKIRSLEVVKNDFHPQSNVKQKTYYYHFSLEKPLPFISRYVYWHNLKLDTEKLKVALQEFVGERDFKSFCSQMCIESKKSTIRTIDQIRLEYLSKFKVWRISVLGQSFLHHMIRRIVGAALIVSSNNDRSINEIIRALEEKNPEQNFYTAPANGLLLKSVKYNLI